MLEESAEDSLDQERNKQVCGAEDLPQELSLSGNSQAETQVLWPHYEKGW